MGIKIYRIIQNFLLLLIFLIAISLGTMILILHIKPCVILSGSMEPEIPTGSICFIDEKEKEAKVNDVICYERGDVNIIHRVIRLEDDGYITKGDNNDTHDFGVVRKEQIKGISKFHIPKVGYIANYIKTPKGVLTVLICFILFTGLGLTLDNIEIKNNKTK